MKKISEKPYAQNSDERESLLPKNFVRENGSQIDEAVRKKR